MTGLTRVPVSGEEAGHVLQTRHQEVLGQEVQGGLQGGVQPQHALQAAALDEGHVFVFWGRKRLMGQRKPQPEWAHVPLGGRPPNGHPGC